MIMSCALLILVIISASVEPRFQRSVLNLKDKKSTLSSNVHNWSYVFNTSNEDKSVESVKMRRSLMSLSQNSSKSSLPLTIYGEDTSEPIEGARLVINVDKMVDWDFKDKARTDGFKISTPEQNPYSILVFPLGGNVPQIIGICTGTLISLDWVLTASHCFVMHYVKVSLYAGCSSGRDIISRKPVSKHCQSREVSKDSVHLHPLYDIHTGNVQYDVAVIKVEKPFKSSGTVGFITLSTQPWNYKEYRSCQVTGFGVVQLNEDSPLDFLRKTHTLKVKTPCTCFLGYKKWMICNEFKEDFGLCTGDSGAGLICDNHVVGVASAVLSFKNVAKCVYAPEVLCGVKNTMSMFAPTCTYLLWINSVTKLFNDKQIHTQCRLKFTQNGGESENLNKGKSWLLCFALTALVLANITLYAF